MKNNAVQEKEEVKNNNAVSEKPADVKTNIAKTETPAYPFLLLQRDMNQLFEDFAHGFEMWRPRFAKSRFGDFHITVDLKDNEKELVVTAEVPGVDGKEIELTVSSDSLTISGEKKEEKEETDKGYYRSERNYGMFRRILPLPCEVDKDSVKATFKNGVLKVVMPKCKESMKDIKKVDIKEDN